MSRLDDLAQQFEAHISLPWQKNLSGAERIIFCVYPKEEERKMRIKLKDFETRSLRGGHPWVELDLTNAFAQWMAAQDYREEYFKHPEDMHIQLEEEFPKYCAERIAAVLDDASITDQHLVAVHGVGALFGFTRLHHVLGMIDHKIKGRLAVFFPGRTEANKYHLLDGPDGWSYLATPITC